MLQKLLFKAVMSSTNNLNTFLDFKSEKTINRRIQTCNKNACNKKLKIPMQKTEHKTQDIYCYFEKS